MRQTPRRAAHALGKWELRQAETGRASSQRRLAGHYMDEPNVLQEIVPSDTRGTCVWICEVGKARTPISPHQLACVEIGGGFTAINAPVKLIPECADGSNWSHSIRQRPKAVSVICPAQRTMFAQAHFGFTNGPIFLLDQAQKPQQTRGKDSVLFGGLRLCCDDFHAGLTGHTSIIGSEDPRETMRSAGRRG